MELIKIQKQTNELKNEPDEECFKEINKGSTRSGRSTRLFKQKNNQEDLEWVRVLKSNKNQKNEIFFKLVGKYQDKLYGLALMIIGNQTDAEDALQNAFISVYRSIHKFQGKSSFYTWLYRIVINKARDIRFKNQKRKKTQNSLQNCELEISDKRLNVHDELEKAEMSKFILKKVNMLKNIYKEIIILRYYEQFSYQEISEILNLYEGTVKSRLFKAKQKLRKLIIADRNGGDFIEFI